MMWRGKRSAREGIGLGYKRREIEFEGKGDWLIHFFPSAAFHIELEAEQLQIQDLRSADSVTLSLLIPFPTKSLEYWR
jgi:hypothetical protein